MLRRDRHIRTQIQQLADACIVAVSFWIAYVLRANPQIAGWLHLEQLAPASFNSTDAIWLYFALIPIAPLILESQGFYNRPVLAPRRLVYWPLLKGCFLTTVGLVLAIYAFRLSNSVPRGVTTFFGVISFA